MAAIKAEPWFTLQLGAWACLCVNGETMTVCAPEELKAPKPEPVLAHRGRTSISGATEAFTTSARDRRHRLSRANSCVSNAASEVSAISAHTCRQRPSGLPTLDSDEEADAAGDELPTLLRRNSSVRRFLSTTSQVAEESTDIARVPASARKLRFSASSDAMSPRKTNFSGRWILDRVDGDFDAFLADIGTKWMLRKMARSVNYGVGRSVQDISLNGDEFTVVSEGGPSITKLVLHIGRGEEESIGLDGEPVLVRARWEGQSLWMDSRRKDGAKLPPTRRYLEDHSMVVENSTTSGLVVRRFFVKLSTN